MTLKEDQAQAVSTRISQIALLSTMSCDCLVTKATIDPITAHVGYQGPATKSRCLDHLNFVECQPNDSNF